MKADPNKAHALTERGAVKAKAYELGEAQRDLNDAIKLDPGSVEARSKRGMVNLRASHFERALTDYKEAIKHSPEVNPELIARHAHALCQLGKPDEALKEYNRALKLDPSLAEGYYGRGNAYKAQGKFEEALAEYSHAIDLAPTQPVLYLNRGIISQYLKRYSEAIYDYTKCIDLGHPRIEAAYANRGMAYKELDRFQEALEDFDEAIRRKPDYPEAILNRLEVRRALGQRDETSGELEKALASAGDNAEAYNAVAWRLAVSPDAGVRDGKNAVRYATKACEVTHWKNPTTLDSLAAAFAESGNFEEAVRSEKKALSMISETDPMREGAEQRLHLYKKKLPYHETKSP